MSVRSEPALASAHAEAPPIGVLSDTAPNLTPPPGNPRFPRFDSLRAIAALSVLLGHTVTQHYTLSEHRKLFLGAVQVADQGVAIFFLISGFLLYRPFLVARLGGRPIRLRDYARRRFLRIVPAYWVALSLFLLAGFVTGVTGRNWWEFYGFAQVYSPQSIASGIGVAWTLCIEVSFYVILPLFAAAAAGLGRERGSVRGDCALLVLLSIGSLVFRGHFHAFSDFATVRTLPGTFLWFALGMGLAIASVVDPGPALTRSTRAVAQRPTLWWVSAILTSAVLFVLIDSRQTVAVQLAVYVLYGVVALFVLLPGTFGDDAGGLPQRVLGWRFLAWVGLISYSLYLYHTIVIAQIQKALTQIGVANGYAILLVSALVLSIACAAVSYYLVERPAMRLRKHARMSDSRP